MNLFDTAHLAHHIAPWFSQGQRGNGVELLHNLDSVNLAHLNLNIRTRARARAIAGTLQTTIKKHTLLYTKKGEQGSQSNKKINILSI
jgi:hypothetical protein